MSHGVPTLAGEGKGHSPMRPKHRHGPTLVRMLRKVHHGRFRWLQRH
jgi:hypothetical protein